MVRSTINYYMAKLTTKQRKALPPTAYAIPETKSFPIENSSHAANAKARASQSGDPAVKAKVDAAVARRFPDMGKKDNAPAVAASKDKPKSKKG